VLSHLLNMAVEWGWLTQKPCKIVKYREDSRRIEYLTEVQMEALLAAAKRDRYPEIYLFMLIGLSTSMRKGEILRIKVEDIDFGQKLIHVPVAKAGARPQPFPETLVLELKRYLRKHDIETGWLFPAERSQAGHRMNLEKPFRRVEEAAGLDPQRVLRHTLRHTCITHLVQQGIDLPTVAVISGHKTLQMVQRYAHQNNAHIQAAFKKLEERLPTPTPPRERVRLVKRGNQ
jgi:integrase